MRMQVARVAYARELRRRSYTPAVSAAVSRRIASVFEREKSLKKVNKIRNVISWEF